jgi:hypothetical protein
MTITERLKDMLTNDAPPRPSARASQGATAAGAAVADLDRSFATRAVQLSAARAAADKRLLVQRAASEQALRNAERAHADDARALALAEEQVRTTLRAALVRDAHQAFESPVAAWFHEPSRIGALAIVDALTVLARRELTELGPTAARPHVLLALSHAVIDGVAQDSPCVLVTLANDSGWPSRVVGALASVMSKAVMPALEGRAVSGAVAEALMVELEASVEAAAASNRDRPLEARTRARWQLVKQQDAAALAAFDGEIVREQAQANEVACSALRAAVRAQNAEPTSHSWSGEVVGFE